MSDLMVVPKWIIGFVLFKIFSRNQFHWFHHFHLFLEADYSISCFGLLIFTEKLKEKKNIQGHKITAYVWK